MVLYVFRIIFLLVKANPHWDVRKKAHSILMILKKEEHLSKHIFKSAHRHINYPSLLTS